MRVKRNTILLLLHKNNYNKNNKNNITVMSNSFSYHTVILLRVIPYSDLIFYKNVPVFMCGLCVECPVAISVE